MVFELVENEIGAHIVVCCKIHGDSTRKWEIQRSSLRASWPVAGCSVHTKVGMELVAVPDSRSADPSGFPG
jgi:hypothetical protein